MKKTLIASVSIVAMVAVAAVVYYNFFYVLPITVVSSQVMTEGAGTDEVQIRIIDLPMDEKGKFDEVVTENSDVVKLTHSDGSGWNLKKGETLSFSYRLNLNKVKGSDKELGEGMEIGYIKDNVRYMGFQGKQKEFEYQITADSDGEYYPCFQNLCAGYIVATKISVQ